ncbi:MAG TPA: hypothetical protein H9694_00930 [Firmicutes bacterium]|nr:hypothetical protein [Bacillota bacterium]
MPYQGKHLRKNTGSRRFSRKALALCAALVLAAGGAVGGTVAWLTAVDGPVENVFTPAQVSCAVDEDFSPSTGVKENVRVQNTSNVPAYIRVRLVGYTENSAGEIIAGTGVTPDIAAPQGWILSDGYYYCQAPVAAGAYTPELIPAYTLTEDSQVLEVLAEAIQSQPAAVVQDAWGVTLDADGLIQG